MICSYIDGMSIKKPTYKKGERVEFAQVTRKYGCRGGIIKKKVTLYTDDTPKYPMLPLNHLHGGMKAINIYREKVEGFARELKGYVVDAVGECGDHVETVCVTEEFIRGSFD